jgi:hypothetical protein
MKVVLEVTGREILNLLSGLYILSPHQEITMTMWFHHNITKVHCEHLKRYL